MANEKNKQILTSFVKKQNVLTQTTKRNGVDVNVNVYRGGCERCCRSVEPAQPCGVEVAWIHLPLFPSEFWNTTACFPEARLSKLSGVSSINYWDVGESFIPKLCAKAEPTWRKILDLRFESLSPMLRCCDPVPFLNALSFSFLIYTIEVLG